MGQKYYIFDNIIATAGQTLFNVSKIYKTGSLVVTLNDVTVTLGASADYIEQPGNLSILFNKPLAASDRVIIASSISTDNPIQVISNNLTNSNSIFQKYGSEIKLLNNNVFTVDIKVKKQRYGFEFTSAYSAYATTSDKIRGDTGDLLIGVADWQIDYLIYLNTKEMNMTYKVNNIVDPITATVTPTVIMQYKKAWVRYKTDLDLVNAAYLSISGVAGGVSKKIGEVTIDKKFSIPKLKEMISMFSTKFQGYDEFILNKQMSQVFIKSKNNAYPYSGRAGF